MVGSFRWNRSDGSSTPPKDRTEQTTEHVRMRGKRPRVARGCRHFAFLSRCVQMRLYEVDERIFLRTADEAAATPQVDPICKVVNIHANHRGDLSPDLSRKGDHVFNVGV